ncbi:hypothetical protein ABEG18_00130 [Alsobacter sp. KACC 23698]|uniref:Lipoprotein n=1 Tax=Alsobacter sp. KACC 23698 TaxID=3149229 RepID=A0AAU7JG35_9HYPH
MPSAVSYLMRLFVATAAALGCGALASCNTTGDSPVATRAVATAPPYPVDRLVGSWGVASYRDEKDRARTEAQARAQCKLPYVIAKGPSDGVMMHVADDATLHELTLKGGPGGKTYLGFEGPPGDDQDREMLSVSDTMLVARFVNPDVNTRYGTFVYIRCK